MFEIKGSKDRLESIKQSYSTNQAEVDLTTLVEILRAESEEEIENILLKDMFKKSERELMFGRSFTLHELLELGFKRTDVTAEESGEEAYSYFTFDWDGAESLITDEGKGGYYTVEMFNVKKPKPLSKSFVKMYIKEFK